MTTRIQLAAVLLLCLLASACMRSMPEPPPATEHKYLLTQGLKYEDVWVASVRAMTKSLNIYKMDQREGVIQGRLADWGFGEYLRITVRPEPGVAASYRLEVLSTRSRSVVMRDWADGMRRDLENMIDKLPNYKAGQVRQASEPMPAK